MIRIGGASGYWGDSPRATPQLLGAGVDVLVYDYLAEITMSILARIRARDPEGGYATDFISLAMKPFLDQIAASGTKVVSNAGGVNPRACGRALEALIDKAGLDLKVAVVDGDDLMPKLAQIAEEAPDEMFSGRPFPEQSRIVSANAYLGAFPIAEALSRGADIVVTGRTVDSAATLGALIAEYGWRPDALDHLAAGSLVGHILECGAQATGGNFTDWRDVPRREAIGYPIAEVEEDGAAVITKPDGSGGLVSRGTVAEQLLYEIADPSAYLLPDVTCDFTQVTVEEAGPDRVEVSGAKGTPASDRLKVCATFMNGWRGGLTPSFYGSDATERAEAFARATFSRAEESLRLLNLPPFDETSVEILGSGAQFGESLPAEEVVLKMAARHPEEKGVGVLLREAAGMGLSAPPGLCGFAGTRPKPSPVIELFSFTVPRDRVVPHVSFMGAELAIENLPPTGTIQPTEHALDPPQGSDVLVEAPLAEAAFARSGDKGDAANVGVIARHPGLLPYLWEQLTEELVSERFAHITDAPVKRYLLPGPGAINFVLERSLGGGGVASLRNDPQGKGFSQVMLTLPVRVPERLLRERRS